MESYYFSSLLKMAIGNISTYEVKLYSLVLERQKLFFFFGKKKMVEFWKDIDKRYN